MRPQLTRRKPLSLGGFNEKFAAGTILLIIRGNLATAPEVVAQRASGSFLPVHPGDLHETVARQGGSAVAQQSHDNSEVSCHFAATVRKGLPETREPPGKQRAGPTRPPMTKPQSRLRHAECAARKRISRPGPGPSRSSAPCAGAARRAASNPRRSRRASPCPARDPAR